MHPTVNNVDIKEEAISPIVLKCLLFNSGTGFPQGHCLGKRYVYDYEFELMTYSNGAMLIDDTVYPINKGDIVFRRPGQITEGIMQYNCYLICFDLLGRTGKDPNSYDFSQEQAFQNNYLNTVLNCIPSIYHPSSIERYQHLFEATLKEYINPSPASQLVLKSYILQLLYNLYIDTTNPLTGIEIPSSPYYHTIKKALEYINNNIDKKISLLDLSRVVDLSPNYFHKIFSEMMNTTPNEYITYVKLKKAKELIVTTNIPISKIAYECGFENIPYFSYIFNKEIGISPAKYRKQNSYV